MGRFLQNFGRLFLFGLLLTSSLELARAANDCAARIAALTKFDPARVSSTRDILSEQYQLIRTLKAELENSAKTTEDRKLILRADAWAEALKDRLASNPDAESFPGAFVLGFSPLGATLGADADSANDSLDFKPKFSPVTKIKIANLPKSDVLSETQVRELVGAAEAGGKQGLNQKVGEINRRAELADLLRIQREERTDIVNLLETLRKRSKWPGDPQSRDLDVLIEEVRAGQQYLDAATRDGKADLRLTAQAYRVVLGKLDKEIAAQQVSPARGSLDEFLFSPLGDSVPREAFQPKPLPMPPEMLKVVKANFGDEDATSSQSVMEAILNNELARAQLAEAADRTLEEISKKVDQRFRESNGILNVDLLFVGAGLHEQNMQNYLAQNGFTNFTDDPNARLKILTVEKRERVGTTFYDGGTAFSLNSSSKAEDPSTLRQRLGEADLNFLPGGPAQLNVFSRQKNPPAEQLSQAVRINRAIAGGAIALNAEVASLKYIPSNSTWQATLSDGRRVLTRSIVLTGIGDAKFPPITGIKELYERNKSTSPDKPSGILTYADFMRFVNGTKRPLSPFANKSVAVIGKGDSGKAVVRWLSGGANDQSYKLDTRRIPFPKFLPWFGQTCLTCDQFIQENRSFYFPVAENYRNNRIVPKENLTAIKQLPDGRFALGFKILDGTNLDQAQDLSKIDLARVPPAERDIVKRSPPNQPVIADYVVVTTGYEYDLRGLLFGKSISNTNAELVRDPKIFRNVEGYEPSLGRVKFAKQYLDRRRPVDLYLLGPLAGRDIVGAPELLEIDENFVANANHNWRVWRTIEALTQKLLTTEPTKADASAAPSPKTNLNALDEAVSNLLSRAEDLGIRPKLLAYILTQTIGQSANSPIRDAILEVSLRNPSIREVSSIRPEIESLVDQLRSKTAAFRSVIIARIGNTISQAGLSEQRKQLEERTDTVATSLLALDVDPEILGSIIKVLIIGIQDQPNVDYGDFQTKLSEAMTKLQIKPQLRPSIMGGYENLYALFKTDGLRGLRKVVAKLNPPQDFSLFERTFRTLKDQILAGKLSRAYVLTVIDTLAASLSPLEPASESLTKEEFNNAFNVSISQSGVVPPDQGILKSLEDSLRRIYRRMGPQGLIDLDKKIAAAFVP